MKLLNTFSCAVRDYIIDLIPLEERMVSPIANFMQIRALPPNTLILQLGLEGSIVNMPVEIDGMVQMLPRNFNQMQTIQIKFKRHSDHKSDYMFETVRPTSVCAVEWFG